MTEAHLNHADLHHILSKMPSALRNLIKNNSLMLAGGAIRSLITRERISDWDLFGADEYTLKAVAAKVEAAYGPGSRTHKSKNAYTILAHGRTPVQLIRRWLYTSPEQLWQDFDFTVARAVIWYDTGKGWCSATDPNYYADLASRRLRYCAPERQEDAGGSMMRVMKFVSKGYIIAPEDLAMVMSRITRRIRWEHELVRKDDGARIMAGLLREVDPLTIIDGVEMEEETPATISEEALRGIPGEDVDWSASTKEVTL